MSVHAAHTISILFIGEVPGGCASIPRGRAGVEWTSMRGTETKPLTEGLHLSVARGLISRTALASRQQESNGVYAD